MFVKLFFFKSSPSSEIRNYQFTHQTLKNKVFNLIKSKDGFVLISISRKHTRQHKQAFCSHRRMNTPLISEDKKGSTSTGVKCPTGDARLWQKKVPSINWPKQVNRVSVQPSYFGVCHLVVLNRESSGELSSSHWFTTSSFTQSGSGPTHSGWVEAGQEFCALWRYRREPGGGCSLTLSP